MHPALKLESLTLSYLNIGGLKEKLLFVLKERRDHGLCLTKLIVQSCWMHGFGDELKFKELVGEVEWDVDVTVAGEDSSGSDSNDSDSDDSGESTDSEITGSEGDVDLCELLRTCIS